MSEQKFEGWCVVELFGHHQIAGYVSEQTIGGCGFVRVDVPATGGLDAHTKLYGEKAIYAIHPCTEEIAKQAAASLGRSGTALPVYVPDLSAAQDTLAEARRAADWLRNQQAEIAAVLRRTAEGESQRLLQAASARPWETGRDYEEVDDDVVDGSDY
jgi:acyl-CoA reductase-like NAD-dependent aldehyde dehydrogenase